MIQTLLLVNFGGPRSLSEIEPFLSSLLTDRELIHTRLPTFLHNFLFRRIAKKRAPIICADYELIGGKSPIYFTTEALAEQLKKQTKKNILTFHRYLTSTHKTSLKAIEETPGDLLVLPLFPQFSYATTGSIATFFREHLSTFSLQRLRWIKSYPAHPAFIKAWEIHIRSFLHQHNIAEHEAHFLFSAHGLPLSFVQKGDPYEFECQQSVQAILQRFPNATGELAYQSKFGKGEWLRPYTNEICEKKYHRPLIFIPIAFTSDHIETLFEIEQLYLPKIIASGCKALRCPSFHLEPYWIEAILALFNETTFTTTRMLIRNTGKIR